MAEKIAVEQIHHIGVRVRDLDRALVFYRVLGFELLRRVEGDDVAIIRTSAALNSISCSMPMQEIRRPTS